VDKVQGAPEGSSEKNICPYLVVAAAILEAGVMRGKDWKTLNLLPEKLEVAESERKNYPTFPAE